MNEEILKLKSKKCLKCGALTSPGDDKEFFCSKCGAPVLNICSDYACGQPLAEDALYCKHCGSPSTFKNFGLFNSKSDVDTDLPF